MTETRTRRCRDEKPFVCRRCGGPARAYLGSVHRWTCRSCVDGYIEQQHAP